MNLKTLIKRASDAGACALELNAIKECKTLEQALTHPRAAFWAYRLRRDVPDLPEEVQREAELKACEEPEWACRLRTEVQDLPEEVQRAAELKACTEAAWAYRLWKYVPDLHPDTLKRLEELGE